MTAAIYDLSEYGRPFQMTSHEGGGAGSGHVAEVRPFNQALTLCGRCGSAKHRASKCPATVPRSVANDPV